MKRPSVELTVGFFGPKGLLFNVTDYQENRLGEDLTLEQVFANDEWVVAGIIQPSRIPHVVFDDPQREFLALQEVQRELEALRFEKSSVCNQKRYEELISPFGPIRTLERKADVLRVVGAVMIKSLTGFWPRELRKIEIF